MKKLILLLSIFSLLSFQSVKSEEMYIGIDYLNNEIETGVTNISSTLDEKDSGYSLYAGLPMSENMDIEVSYNDFGEASLSGVSGNQFKIGSDTYEFTATASLAVSATSIGVAAKQKFKKGSLYCPFFMSALKIFNEGYNEVSTKSSFP